MALTELALETLVTQYGYLAVLLGSFFEGETVLIAVGYLAHREYLNILLVILISFIGAFLFEQGLFMLGRWHGHKLIKKIKNKNIKLKIGYVHELFEKYPKLTMFGLRFVYGFRSLRVITFSTSKMNAWKFTGLNSISILIWVVFWNMLGFILGEILQALLGRMKSVELKIAVIILIIGLIVWIYHAITNKITKNGKIKIIK